MKATDIECPACHAAPGKFCKRNSRGRSHRIRRDLAKAMSTYAKNTILSIPELIGNRGGWKKR